MLVTGSLRNTLVLPDSPQTMVKQVLNAMSLLKWG